MPREMESAKLDSEGTYMGVCNSEVGRDEGCSNALDGGVTWNVTGMPFFIRINNTCAIPMNEDFSVNEVLFSNP